MKRFFLVLAATFICGIGIFTFCSTNNDKPLVPEEDSSQFVNITDVVPDAILEIRYYSTYNFVGSRVDGYEQPVALMTRQAADSLKAASDELREQGYRLKIWDSYRPQTAVNHFIRWAEDLQDTTMKIGRASCRERVLW